MDIGLVESIYICCLCFRVANICGIWNINCSVDISCRKLYLRLKFVYLFSLMMNYI